MQSNKLKQFLDDARKLIDSPFKQSELETCLGGANEYARKRGIELPEKEIENIRTSAYKTYMEFFLGAAKDYTIIIPMPPSRAKLELYSKRIKNNLKKGEKYANKLGIFERIKFGLRALPLWFKYLTYPVGLPFER